MVMSWSRLSDFAFLRICMKVVSSLGSTSQWSSRPTVRSWRGGCTALHCTVHCTALH
jgi:hypothetical protein